MVQKKEAQAGLLVWMLFRDVLASQRGAFDAGNRRHRVSQAAITCSLARLLATEIGEQDLNIVLDLLRQGWGNILAAYVRRKQPSQFLWSQQCSQLFLLFHQVIEGVDANTAGLSMHSRRHGGGRHDWLTTGALSYKVAIAWKLEGCGQSSRSRTSTAAGQSERSSMENAPFPDTFLHGQ